MGSLTRKRVLIIDDEQEMRRLVAARLGKEGASVITASDGVEGLRRLYETQPDLVILDVMMPRMNGWEVLDRIRKMTDLPVIMLTVLNGSENEFRALNSGADDFISKPFDVKTLVARAKIVLLRKRSILRRSDYDDGHLFFDGQRRQVIVGEEQIRLTRKEYELLEFFIHHAGRVCTYKSILDDVWGGEDQGSADNVHVFIWQLRQKIEPDPRNPIYFVNVPSVGYIFGRETRLYG